MLMYYHSNHGFSHLKNSKTSSRHNPEASDNTNIALNKMVISICLLQIISTTSIATVLVVELVTQTRSIYNTWIGHLLMLTSHVLHPVLFFHFTFCHRFCRPTVSFRVSTNHNMDTRM